MATARPEPIETTLEPRCHPPGAEIDYKLLAESSNDVIIQCDASGIASYVSPSVSRLLGITPEDLLGGSHFAYVLPEDLGVLDEVLDRHSSGQATALATFRMRRRDGSTVWVEGNGRVIAHPVTGAVNHVVVLRDVTERKHLEQRLTGLAMTDGLTGLANRRAFDEALARECRRARRAGRPVSLLLLDLDHFKAFNDHYGHLAGDDALRSVGMTVARQLSRGGDIGARYGGEEFAAILTDTDAAGAAAKGAAICQGVQALAVPHVRNLEGSCLVTVSVGTVTAIPGQGTSAGMPARLIEAADKALYRAKRAGRNRVATARRLLFQPPVRARGPGTERDAARRPVHVSETVPEHDGAWPN